MEKHRIGDGEGAGFRVLGGTIRSQGAVMVLAPGEATGGPDNRHETSDQWLFVASGSGSATVDGAHVTLAAGDLLLIAAGEGHEIRAGDDEPLVTVNVYAPPEY
ncbi:cupin domain-containing protein [soil metagenome]|nr:cupin domain-containing protein [Trueperaceae bacterium]